MKIIDDITLWLVKLLAKLRLQNVIVFGLLQVILIYFAGYFAVNDVIPTPETIKTILSYIGIKDLNWLVAGFLGAIVAALNPGLSDKIKAYKEEGKMQ